MTNLAEKIEEIRKEMPTYKLNCKVCGKMFDKFLTSSDISSVICSVCSSPDIKRVFAEDCSATKIAISIPAGALSGGSCKSGFS